ncbi:MAG: hypothetical protein QM488_19410 [Rhizobiaceae bacterium]
MKTSKFLGTLISFIISAAAILLLGQLGFWVWLVAHPFWNFKGALIGIAIGTGVLLLGWLFIRNRYVGNIVILGLPILAILISYGISFYGKMGFAESFGEDRTSGAVWYYGYLALTSSCFVIIFASINLIFARKIIKSDSM